MTRMKAFSRGLSASIRCRHSSVTCAEVTSRARNRRPNSSMVIMADAWRPTTDDWRLIEVGGTDRGNGLRERLEQRFQLGQPAPLGISHSTLQPRINLHQLAP